jgi:hypothetical protein
MVGFVRWLGFLAAIGAGLLGAVWVIEAMPPGEAAVTRAVDACLRNAPGGMGLSAMEARLRCHDIKPIWNEALVLRGLVALAIGVALAMMAARLPAPETGRAEAEREAEALRVLIEDEKRRARLHGGNPISHAEAEARARRRLRGEG